MSVHPAPKVSEPGGLEGPVERGESCRAARELEDDRLRNAVAREDRQPYRPPVKRHDAVRAEAVLGSVDGLSQGRQLWSHCGPAALDPGLPSPGAALVLACDLVLLNSCIGVRLYVLLKSAWARAAEVFVTESHG